MSNSSIQVAALISQARTGSREALGHLLDSYRDYLRLVARQQMNPRLVGKGDPSDLIQETFLEAQRDFTQFQGDTEGELLAWLRQLLLNNISNFSRHYMQTSKRDARREIRLSGPADSDQVSLLGAEPSPSDHVVGAEESVALHHAIERLPEEYRRIIQLRYQDGRSFEEIAIMLGRSANAARKLWVRAIDRLQEDLDIST